MKKALSLLVSLLLLGIIYSRIDLARFGQALRNLDAGWFLLALACFIPQTAVSGLRWQRLLGRLARLPFREAVQQILASSTLNVLLPSKMGDLAKGYFLAQRSAVGLRTGLFLAAAEKLLDLGALSAVLLGANLLLGLTRDPLVVTALVWSAGIVAGLALGLAVPLPRVLGRWLPGRVRPLLGGWEDVRQHLVAERWRLLRVLGLTLGLWLLHLVQIHFFFLSVGSHPPALKVYAFTPVAILVGLLPISQAGIGTRDAALIYLFAADESPAVLASVGLLTVTRYLIPALGGLPFLPLVLEARAALRSAR